VLFDHTIGKQSKRYGVNIESDLLRFVQNDTKPFNLLKRANPSGVDGLRLRFFLLSSPVDGVVALEADAEAEVDAVGRFSRLPR